jgi:single-stranded-DNA-specific exonuclease
VLVRRGLGDPAAARAFLEPEGITHDPLLLGDMARAVERLRAAVERDERICVHGDYDVDGICSTAAGRADAEGDRRRRRLASAEPISRRATASRQRPSPAWPEEGVKLILTVDCGITAVAEVEEARRLGVGHDRHRPSSSRRRVAGLPDRRHEAVGVPVSGPLRHRRRRQARPGAPRR